MWWFVCVITIIIWEAIRVAVLKSISPGMIEDRRFAMFGLADKTKFTQSEYNALLQKYPDFNDFYTNTWKPYIELLQEDITAKTQQKDDLENRLIDLGNKLQDLQSQKSKIEQAIQEQQKENTTTAQVLIDMFNSQLEDILGEIDSINDQLSSTQQTISDLEVAIEEYNTKKTQLEQAVNDYLTKVGGKNPLAG